MESIIAYWIVGIIIYLTLTGRPHFVIDWIAMLITAMLWPIPVIFWVLDLL